MFEMAEKNAQKMIEKIDIEIEQLRDMNQEKPSYIISLEKELKMYNDIYKS